MAPLWRESRRVVVDLVEGEFRDGGIARLSAGSLTRGDAQTRVRPSFQRTQGSKIEAGVHC